MKKIIYFQIYAWFAKKYTIKVSGKKQWPKNMVTFDSTKHYLKTAEKRNKEQMLMEIEIEIAKEFRNHEKY